MTPATPSVPSAPPRRRRRIWPWILALILGPFVVFGAFVVSFITLDRPATLLRREVMHATGADWNIRVQISLGGGTLGIVRAALAFLPLEHRAEVRPALRALKRASVGVYCRQETDRDWSGAAILTRTDAAMAARGWIRMVGVVEQKDTVLIYVPQRQTGDGELDLCLAVVNPRDLIVVSTRVAPAELVELVRRQAPAEWAAHLRVARH